MAANTAAAHALVVVDVQRDFCPGGALAAPDGEAIVPAINQHVADAQADGMAVYATRDWHPAQTTHFKQYGGERPPHCVQHTEGARFHPALQLPAGTIVISKGMDPAKAGYSAFDGETADHRTFLADLRRHHIEHMYVAGIATDYCVKQTVLDALHEGLRVSVLLDAIAPIDAHPGDAERALKEMVEAGAQLVYGDLDQPRKHENAKPG
jgi:nicotinamidase/pyrazinamidase